MQCAAVSTYQLLSSAPPQCQNVFPLLFFFRSSAIHGNSPRSVALPPRTKPLKVWTSVPQSPASALGT